jgi:dienelactone hydrolase
MHRIKNLVISGTENMPMGVDVFFKEEQSARPAVIYVHGFNGFKDWGNFDMVADRFAAADLVLVKFNFSHNGTSPQQPEDFVNLDAFGKNNYTKELEDLTRIIDWVSDPGNPYQAAINAHQIYLMGHSMGGGISILQSAADRRIKKLITWAGISECKTPWGNWPLARLEEWKQTGVQYYTNGRTKQQMPMYYQLYQNYQQNRDRLDIRKAIESLTIPILLCHGTQDGAVLVEKALELKGWQPAAELFTLETDHVFGRKHPWTSIELPVPMEAVVAVSLRFLK